MANFDEAVNSSNESAAFIAEMGGLPEITDASQSFQDAITRTRAEIDAAVFAASRFSSQHGDHFENAVRSVRLSPRAQELIAEKGEGGFKQAELEDRVDAIQDRFSLLLHDLVALRVDLRVSQIEE